MAGCITRICQGYQSTIINTTSYRSPLASSFEMTLHRTSWHDMLRHASISLYDELSRADGIVCKVWNPFDASHFVYVLSTDLMAPLLYYIDDTHHTLNDCKRTGLLLLTFMYSIRCIRCQYSSNLLRVLTIDGQDRKKCMRCLSPMPYFAVMLVSSSPGTHSDFDQYAISLLVCLHEREREYFVFLSALVECLEGRPFFLVKGFYSLCSLLFFFGFIIVLHFFALHLHTLHSPRRKEVKWK